VRGTGLELGRFADRLVGLKGVVYGRLLPATLGHALWRAGRGSHAPAHDHAHAHGHVHEHRRAPGHAHEHRRAPDGPLRGRRSGLRRTGQR